MQNFNNNDILRNDEHAQEIIDLQKKENISLKEQTKYLYQEVEKRENIILDLQETLKQRIAAKNGRLYTLLAEQEVLTQNLNRANATNLELQNKVLNNEQYWKQIVKDTSDALQESEANNEALKVEIHEALQHRQDLTNDVQNLRELIATKQNIITRHKDEIDTLQHKLQESKDNLAMQKIKPHLAKSPVSYHKTLIFIQDIPKTDDDVVERDIVTIAKLTLLLSKPKSKRQCNAYDLFAIKLYFLKSFARVAFTIDAITYLHYIEFINFMHRNVKSCFHFVRENLTRLRFFAFLYRRLDDIRHVCSKICDTTRYSGTIPLVALLCYDIKNMYHVYNIEENYHTAPNRIITNHLKIGLPDKNFFEDITAIKSSDILSSVAILAGIFGRNKSLLSRNTATAFIGASGLFIIRGAVHHRKMITKTKNSLATEVIEAKQACLS